MSDSDPSGAWWRSRADATVVGVHPDPDTEGPSQMISRTVKTLAASLLVAGGVVGAQAAVAHAEIRTAPDGTQTTVCVYDGKDYSVGSKVYHPDGTYQTCKSDGTWQRVKSNTGNDMRAVPAQPRSAM
ncbi:hypothetical protein KAREA_02230 [Prescottella equi]|nr:hypothetical protein KAREA_02230 [Prescottella equi]